MLPLWAIIIGMLSYRLRDSSLLTGLAFMGVFELFSSNGISAFDCPWYCGTFRKTLYLFLLSFFGYWEILEDYLFLIDIYSPCDSPEIVRLDIVWVLLKLVSFTV